MPHELIDTHGIYKPVHLGVRHKRTLEGVRKHADRFLKVNTRNIGWHGNAILVKHHVGILACAAVELPTRHGQFDLFAYTSLVDPEPHLALCTGGVGVEASGLIPVQTFGEGDRGRRKHEVQPVAGRATTGGQPHAGRRRRSAIAADREGSRAIGFPDGQGGGARR